MTSSQINFYMMPEDVAELEQYIKEQGLMIVASKMPEPSLYELNSLIDKNKLITYILHPKHKNLVKTGYITNLKTYYVDETYSPVIEFIKPIFKQDEKALKVGRLYFNKIALSQDDNKWIAKDEEFIKVSTNLFKWFKKHFKNTKKDSWWITPRAANWAEKENGRLLN